MEDWVLQVVVIELLPALLAVGGNDRAIHNIQ